MVLGAAPKGASASTSLSYKLAIQGLARSLRRELGEYGIPVSLTAPLGSTDPAPEHTTGQPPKVPTSLFERVSGHTPALPGAGECARHFIDKMLDGVPYVLAPGRGSEQLGSGIRTWVGYSQLAGALTIMQALCMPLVTMIDAGPPVVWREVVSRCWLTSVHALNQDRGSRPLKEMEA